MNTYKKTKIVMLLTANAVISMFAGALCKPSGTTTATESQQTKVLSKYRSINEMHITTESLYLHKIDELEEELIDTQTALANVQTELDGIKSKKDEAFKYAVAAAPLYELPLKDELQQYTYSICTLYGIEDKYELVLALMWQESNYNVDEISSTNDYGLMQINKCNHSGLREVLGVTDFLDPHDNIQAGVYMLSKLFEKYDSNTKVLMVYNMGPTGAKRLWDRGIHSSNYSRSVTAKLNSLDDYYK